MIIIEWLDWCYPFNTARCESSCSWKYGSSKIIENQRLFF